MTTIYGSLRLRPTRIGFLVEPTNMPQIRRAMQVCSCLWGGAYNPIIPVCNELPEKWRDPRLPSPTGEELAKGYLDFFEPDVFVESEGGLAARGGIADPGVNYGKPRVVSIETFFESGQGNPPKIPFGLSIFDLYRDLYEREFKFVRRHDSNVVLFESGTNSDAFVEAAFGGFPSEGFLSPFAKAFGEMFDPLQLTPSAENSTRAISEGYTTPLLFTAHGMTRERYGFNSGPTLFVVDSNSPIDLIELWNLRLFTPYVFPINVDWMNELSDFMREFITGNYKSLPGNRNGVMIHTTVQFARSIPEERSKRIVTEELNRLPQGSWSYKLWYERIWQVDRTDDGWVRPRRARIAAATTEVELSVSIEQPDRSVGFPSLAPEFASPYGDSEARWVNVLRLHTYSNDESIAVVLPSDLTQQSLIRLRLGSGGVVVSREGLVLPQHFKNHREYLNLPSGSQAITEWLEGHGIEAKASDAGRIADQVLNSVGGFLRAYLLAHRETLQALDEMAKNVRRYPDGKTEEYPDRARSVKFWRV